MSNLSTYAKVCIAAEGNEPLARRIQMACEIKGIPYSFELFKRVLHNQVTKLVEVSEVVRVDGSGLTDANIDTALGHLYPDPEEPEEPVETEE